MAYLTEAAALSFRENVSLARYNTLRVGGPARRLATPDSEAELRAAVHRIRERGERYFVIGNGSNLLVADEGYDGAVLALRKLNDYHLIDPASGSGLSPEDDLPERVRLDLEAGTNNGLLVRTCEQTGVAGLEFLTGIPGTIGGTVAMNGGHFFDRLAGNELRVRYFDGELRPREKRGDECEYSYRSSEFRGLLVSGVSVTLPVTSPEEVSEKVEEKRAYRDETQPWGVKTLGSTFKNPEDGYAGELLERCGLKGAGKGQVHFSELHANFLINEGGGSCNETLALMCRAKRTVSRETGVELEPEVIYIGPNRPEVEFLYGADYPHAY